MARVWVPFLLLTLASRAYSVNYTWNLYPIANKALYGYDQAANKSFKSSDVPDGAKTKVEDGIYALYVPAGEEIYLGDFAGTCVSNTTKCQNFSVSFLLKAQGEKQLKVLDSGFRYGESEEWGWQFKIEANGDYEATVAHGNDIQDRGQKPASPGGWLHVGFTYDGLDCCSGRGLQVFVNGSQATGPLGASSPSFPQDKATRLKLGSKDNDNGFFISNFQFLEMKLSLKDMQEQGNMSFANAMRAYNVTLQAFEKSITLRGDADKVEIPFKRTGDLDVAVSVGFTTTGVTATASKHFIPASNEQLAFAPGEIYKHLEVGIINDKATSGNKTFKVTFNSPEDWVVLNGPKEVNVTIMYFGGPTGAASSVRGKMSHVLLITFLFVISFLLM